jgi:hypothetical protein
MTVKKSAWPILITYASVQSHSGYREVITENAGMFYFKSNYALVSFYVVEGLVTAYSDKRIPAGPEMYLHPMLPDWAHPHITERRLFSRT